MCHPIRRRGWDVSTEQLRASRQVRREGRLTAKAVQSLTDRLLGTGPIRHPRRVSDAVARELQRIDKQSDLTPGARRLLQDLFAWTGLATNQPIALPANDEPYWFRIPHPLANYQSRPELPSSADVVVIGAGLTGSSAAYHLAESLGDRSNVVV